jgi:hypothetical protein
MTDASDKPQATTLQKIFGALALVGAVAALGMTASLAQNTDTTQNYLGGLDFQELIFNYHPVLMVTSLVFCSAWSLLSYRMIPLPKEISKLSHVVFHTVSIICLSIGLYAVVQGNNDPKKNTTGSYYPNLFSLHSFIGITALILYLQNYLLGFLYFFFPGFDIRWKRQYRPNHVLLGLLAFFVSAMAVVTGIMELATENQCTYVSKNHRDTNSFSARYLYASPFI